MMLYLIMLGLSGRLWMLLQKGLARRRLPLSVVVAKLPVSEAWEYKLGGDIH